MTPEILVALEGLSAVFMLVILFACLFGSHAADGKKNWYLYTLCFTIAGLIADMLAWTAEFVPVGEAVQYVCNLTALIMTNFIVSAFGYYVLDQIGMKHSASFVIAHCVTGVNFAAVISTVIAAVSGNLFIMTPDPETGLTVFSDGGLFYEIPMIVSAVSLVFLFALVLHRGKSLSRRKLIVLTVYFLLPLIATALELIDESLFFSYTATAVSMSIVYAMLQSSGMSEMKMREKLLHEISYEDQLTGLLNRRACDRDIALVRKDDTVNVVFCDLNGLKRINDEKGHKAGDEFLAYFAGIITKHFSHDHVYRISGDEFVIIARNMDKEAFDKSIANLRQEIDDNAGIAALGTISGSGEMISELVKKAEMDMYADKKVFYRSHPDYRRGHGD